MIKDWKTYRITGSCVFHVTPIGDRRAHVLTNTCWCKPKLESEDAGTMVVHNAIDEEFYA